MDLRCGGVFVQSVPSKITRPLVSCSNPAMQRRTVLFPAPDGPNKIVMELDSAIRTAASTCGPPSNCLSMSAISTKKPYLSVESVHDGKNHERNDQQHGGSRRCRRVVQALHLVIDVYGKR